MKVLILRNNDPKSSFKWEEACIEKSIDYSVINLLDKGWQKSLVNSNPSFCIAKPPGDILRDKEAFDERVGLIERRLQIPVYPSFKEIEIYENKAKLAEFLEINNLPCPATFITTDRIEANKFAPQNKYPVVAKTLIGAAGSGVKILHNDKQLGQYIDLAFTKGISRRLGPNRKTGNPKLWFIKALKSPGYFLEKVKEYWNRQNDVQKNIVLFQEYIEHQYEWRLVKIGESYFGYKKLKIDTMASGSKEFEYGPVPEQLFEFTKKICDRFGFNFMAIDVFFENDKVLINEMQTIFGHKNSFICKPEDKPGRYLFRNNKWIFEEGNFNTNESYDLRLEVAIKLYEDSE